MKHANTARNQCGLAVLYRIKLCNACKAHKLIFLSEPSVFPNNKCAPFEKIT